LFLGLNEESSKLVKLENKVYTSSKSMERITRLSRKTSMKVQSNYQRKLKGIYKR